jgi:type I restriction enzyme R subunit
VARDDEADAGHAGGLQAAVKGLLRPAVVLDILAHFTLFATDKKKRRIKVVCRYQQYEAVNLIVQRVLAGQAAQGPDLALPGLGQVAAHGVRCAEAAAAARARQPDGHHRRRPHRPRRADQLHLPRLRRAQPREGRDPRRAAKLLKQDTRKIIITTIFKFGEAEGVLNDRGNIVALVDEAHRTQEGDLGIKMRARCRTRSCSASPARRSTGATATPSTRSAPTRTRAAT